MQENVLTLTYHFVCLDGERRQECVMVCLDEATLEEPRGQAESGPEWARLDVEQCEACPLDWRNTEYCPAAFSLAEQVEQFAELVSFTEVEVTVETRERTYSTRTTAQKALSSLAGLKMATCGCPVLAKFKPMARFHLPFATLQETVYRAAGAYLLGQYFRKKRGKSFDVELDGLRKIYADIHAVNVGLSNRLRTVSAGDANVNALVLLDLFTHELPQSIEENLASIEEMFASYLE